MKYIKGDLLKAFDKGEINIIAHQCNSANVAYGGFGAGIAKAIRDRYKGIDELDKKTRANTNPIGQAISFDIDNKRIYNLYSQYFIGSPSNKLFTCDLSLQIDSTEFKETYDIPDNFMNRLNWLKTSLTLMSNDLPFNHTNELTGEDSIKIGIPLLASGLASQKDLKKNLTDLEYFKMYIAPVVQDTLGGYSITVYYL